MLIHLIQNYSRIISLNITVLPCFLMIWLLWWSNCNLAVQESNHTVHLLYGFMRQIHFHKVPGRYQVSQESLIGFKVQFLSSAKSLSLSLNTIRECAMFPAEALTKIMIKPWDLGVTHRHLIGTLCSNKPMFFLGDATDGSTECTAQK